MLTPSDRSGLFRALPAPKTAPALLRLRTDHHFNSHNRDRHRLRHLRPPTNASAPATRRSAAQFCRFWAFHPRFHSLLVRSSGDALIEQGFIFPRNGGLAAPQRRARSLIFLLRSGYRVYLPRPVAAAVPGPQKCFVSSLSIIASQRMGRDGKLSSEGDFDGSGAASPPGSVSQKQAFEKYSKTSIA